jgi:DNA-binding NtrC family response regulator
MSRLTSGRANLPSQQLGAILCGAVEVKLLVMDPLRALSPRVESALRREFDIEHVFDLTDARESHYDAIVLMWNGEDTAAACRKLVESGRASDLVLLGKEASLKDAVGAIRAQASDFVPDGHDPEAVVGSLQAVRERRTLRNELRRLRATPLPEELFPELLGESAGMQRLRDRLEKAARSDVTVLVTGESGTGKEVVARALHGHSARASGPFVPVGCSAIPRHLIESEFFGFVRGAFTDASGDRAGLLVQASGGTLFLDDIGDMPLELQAKLLRALQQRSVRPLGGREEVSFDVRVVAASNRDLERDVAAGRLRQDLYFRLNVLRVRVPPLCERGADVLLLAQHFIRRASRRNRPVVGLTPAAARALLAYDWPGNVRELEHCILAAVAVARYDHVTASDLVESVRGKLAVAEEQEEVGSLADVERQHILNVLRSVGGNKALASKLLGLDRKTLYRKLRQFGPDATAEPAK